MNHQGIKGQLTNVFFEYLRLIILKTYGDRAFWVAAPRLWNALPMHIKLSPSVPVFKNRLKTHFSELFNYFFFCVFFFMYFKVFVLYSF